MVTCIPLVVRLNHVYWSYDVREAEELNFVFFKLKKILDKGNDISPIGTTNNKDKQEVSLD